MVTDGEDVMIEEFRLVEDMGQIIGHGYNFTGLFQCRGCVIAGKYLVLAKRHEHQSYEELQTVIYLGTWDGQSVRGVWNHSTPSLNAGPFELWPVKDSNLNDRDSGGSEVTKSD